MFKNKDEKRKLYFIIILGLVAGIALWFYEGKHVDDNNENARDKSGIKEEARNEREFVKVKSSVFADLVKQIKRKNASYANLGEPVYLSDTVLLDVSKLQHAARQYFIGSLNNVERWEHCYTPAANFHFPYALVERDSIVGMDTIVCKDTVVDCPAYIFAKLVEEYEKE